MARIDGILTAKTAAHARTLGSSAAEVMRLALKAEGDPRAADPGIHTVWGEIDERTATEQANVAQIAKNMGAPDEASFAMLPDVDQAEAARWVRQNRGRSLLFGEPDADLEDVETVADPTVLRNQSETLGQLIRAGGDPEEAAARVGLAGLEFTGAIPVSLRPLATEAASLEDA